MLSIVFSLAVVVVGAWFALGYNNTDMGLLGAMLLMLGTIFLLANVYLHRKGLRVTRRRRP